MSAELEVEIEVPEVEVEVEISPEVEVEVEIEAPEVAVEVDAEIEVEVESDPVIELEAPLDVEVVVEEQPDLAITAELERPVLEVEVESGGNPTYVTNTSSSPAKKMCSSTKLAVTGVVLYIVAFCAFGGIFAVAAAWCPNGQCSGNSGAAAMATVLYVIFGLCCTAGFAFCVASCVVCCLNAQSTLGGTRTGGIGGSTTLVFQDGSAVGGQPQYPAQQPQYQAQAQYPQQQQPQQAYYPQQQNQYNPNAQYAQQQNPNIRYEVGGNIDGNVEVVVESDAALVVEGQTDVEIELEVPVVEIEVEAPVVEVELAADVEVEVEVEAES